MGARQKLNRFHLVGDIFVAALIGMFAQSWIAFFLALAMLGLDVHTGAVRPVRRPSDSSEERFFAMKEELHMKHHDGPLPALITNCGHCRSRHRDDAGRFFYMSGIVKG